MMRPPFHITDEIVSLVADIAELVGHVSARSEMNRNPMLRRAALIRTIHGSLAIEQNTLTLEQVTAVLNGKTVIAPPKDIEEVRNAYEIYEHLDELEPCSEADLLRAHGIMMRGLIADAGEYRTRPVGVINERHEVIHFGTLPDYVPSTVADLMDWLRRSPTHPLIKSCVFHYEFELIHPFLDGNGRTGRLWHTLILSKWNPIFAWLPVESMIYKHQPDYYHVINRCNDDADSTEFISFMLTVIREALLEVTDAYPGTSQEQVPEQVTEQVSFEDLLEFCREPRSRSEMQAFCHVEGRKKFNTDYLYPLLADGRLVMTVPDKPTSRIQKYYAP